MSFFEKITDGLKLYELLMLGFGSLMFIVILLLLVIFAISKRPLKQLLLYFAIAVLMLGWPSWQRIKIDEKGVEVEKISKQYEDNPTAENKKQVENLLGQLKERNVKNPDVVTKIAIAEFRIGKSTQALNTISTLSAEEQHDPSVSQLKSSIQVNDSLARQLRVVQNNPADSNEIKKLNELHTKAVSLRIKSPKLDSSIHAADQEITDYQSRHPRVNIRSVRTIL